MTDTIAKPFLGYEVLFAAAAETTFGTPIAIGSLTNAFVPVSSSMARKQTILERDGLRGTRSHASDDLALGPDAVGGNLLFEPTPVDLTFWWPFILGLPSAGMPGTTPWLLAETLPSFTWSEKRNVENFQYQGCTVNRAVISGSQGGICRLSLDVVAQAELLNTTSWLTADVTQPYLFSDLTLTLTTALLNCRDFELTIDNALLTGRYMNRTTVASLPAGDRGISLKTTTAWDSTNAAIAALYNTGLTGFSGATLELSTGTPTTTFTFGKLNAPAESPTRKLADDELGSPIGQHYQGIVCCTRHNRMN